MIEEQTLSIHEKVSNPLKRRNLGGLLDIVMAYVPLVLFGYMGERLGLKTFQSGMVIILGYALSIFVATYVLKLRNSNWLEIGLTRPQSWLRTVLLGIGAWIRAMVVIVAITVIVVNLPGLVIAELPTITIRHSNTNKYFISKPQIYCNKSFLRKHYTSPHSFDPIDL